MINKRVAIALNFKNLFIPHSFKFIHRIKVCPAFQKLFLLGINGHFVTNREIKDGSSGISLVLIGGLENHTFRAPGTSSLGLWAWGVENHTDVSKRVVAANGVHSGVDWKKNVKISLLKTLWKSGGELALRPCVLGVHHIMRGNKARAGNFAVRKIIGSIKPGAVNPLDEVALCSAFKVKASKQLGASVAITQLALSVAGGVRRGAAVY